jgi:hypothetical protein
MIDITNITFSLSPCYKNKTEECTVQGRCVQDVRRSGRQHQGDVPAHGQVGGA